ncbi:GIY-YIG nuclease family protein [Leptolyngbyaceae cyanobacterium UHCC 1019]
MTMGYVYLLAETDDGIQHTGLYKIGKTTQTSAAQRKRQYQAGNARPLVVVHEEVVSDCHKIEATLKHYWIEQGKHYYFEGGGIEWFRFDLDDVETTINFMNEFAYREPAYSEPVCHKPIDESNYSDDSEFPVAIVLIASVFLFVLAAGFSQYSPKQTTRTNESNFNNTTIGNPYQVRCIRGYPDVNLRASPSLNAPIKDVLQCDTATVIVTGEPIATDDYWYPVRTSKGMTGYIAKVAIDP